MKTEEQKETKEQTKENKGRRIVIPGEVIASGTSFLPGEGAQRQGTDVTATRFGILEMDDRLVKVVALSGTYIPRKGNVVIGSVSEITFNGWVIDINSPYTSFLPIMECKGFVSKRDDLSLIYNYGDMVIAQVVGVKAKGVDLSTKERGFDKLEDGLVISINSNKVPRVIGKQGSMVNLIKEYTGCEIVVGQNGVIWMKGESIDAELVAKEAIHFIDKNSLVEGLTEKVKDFLEEKTSEKGKK